MPTDDDASSARLLNVLAPFAALRANQPITAPDEPLRIETTPPGLRRLLKLLSADAVIALTFALEHARIDITDDGRRRVVVDTWNRQLLQQWGMSPSQARRAISELAASQLINGAKYRRADGTLITNGPQLGVLGSAIVPVEEATSDKEWRSDGRRPTPRTSTHHPVGHTVDNRAPAPAQPQRLVTNPPTAASTPSAALASPVTVGHTADNPTPQQPLDIEIDSRKIYLSDNHLDLDFLGSLIGHPTIVSSYDDPQKCAVIHASLDDSVRKSLHAWNVLTGGKEPAPNYGWVNTLVRQLLTQPVSSTWPGTTHLLTTFGVALPGVSQERATAGVAVVCATAVSAQPPSHAAAWIAKMIRANPTASGPVKAVLAHLLPAVDDAPQATWVNMLFTSDQRAHDMHALIQEAVKGTDMDDEETIAMIAANPQLRDSLLNKQA